MVSKLAEQGGATKNYAIPEDPKDPSVRYWRP